MRKLLPSSALCLTILLLLAGSPVFSQLINNGATITIQANAKIICTGDVQNVTGTITNNGKLEVQGNFTNSGTYTTTSDDSLIMTGAGITYLNTGGATLTYLHINKTANTDSLKLAANTTVSNLVFEKGGFTTDLVNNYVLSAPFAATFTFSPGTEITGKVRRTGWANGTAKAFNNANMLVTTNAGTTVPSDFTVTMIPQTGGGNPTQAEREVTRKFQFAATGGSGFTTDITYPYLDGELNTNTEANLVPWQLSGTEWNSKTASVTRNGTTNIVSVPGITTTELANEWKLADPNYTFNVTAQLRASSNGTTMSTGLNNNGLLNSFAQNQPYSSSPYNYPGTESVSSTPGFFAAHPTIVDWVLVEFRKPSTGLAADASSSTITGRKAGFLLSNGSVVNVDGVTPIAYDIAKQGAGFITVRHRNHLGVLSVSVPSNAAGTFANDFTVLANSYKSTGAASNPVVLLTDNIHYGMWAGDLNASGVINGTDISVVKLAIANSATGYLPSDANLSGVINGTDISFVKNAIAGSATGSNPSIPSGPGSTISSAKKIGNVMSNIPDPVTND